LKKNKKNKKPATGPHDHLPLWLRQRKEAVATRRKQLIDAQHSQLTSDVMFSRGIDNAGYEDAIVEARMREKDREVYADPLPEPSLEIRPVDFHDANGVRNATFFHKRAFGSRLGGQLYRFLQRHDRLQSSLQSPLPRRLPTLCMPANYTRQFGSAC
jgi:hypothetical protein